MPLHYIAVYKRTDAGKGELSRAGLRLPQSYGGPTPARILFQCGLWGPMIRWPLGRIHVWQGALSIWRACVLRLVLLLLRRVMPSGEYMMMRMCGWLVRSMA